MQTVELDRMLLIRVVNQLEVSEHALSYLILSTPTGERRNKLTEYNLLRMELITILRRKLWRPGHPEDCFEKEDNPDDEVAFMVGITRGELNALRDGDGNDTEVVIMDIIRQCEKERSKDAADQTKH